MTLLSRFLATAFALLCMSTCSSSSPPVTSVPTGPMSRAVPQRGFWDRLSDQLTERECYVYRFSCPYGFGPAGEPCECTDPTGLVRRGTTVK